MGATYNVVSGEGIKGTLTSPQKLVGVAKNAAPRKIDNDMMDVTKGQGQQKKIGIKGKNRNEVSKPLAAGAAVGSAVKMSDGTVYKFANTCDGKCNCPDCGMKGAVNHSKVAKTAGIDVNDLAAGVRSSSLGY